LINQRAFISLLAPRSDLHLRNEDDDNTLACFDADGRYDEEAMGAYAIVVATVMDEQSRRRYGSPHLVEGSDWCE
jgi:hypothetical protein